MRRVLASAAVLLAVVGFMILATGSGSGAKTPTFGVELDNAFGLIPGADFKVAGVRAGTIKSVDLCSQIRHSGCQNPLHALIKVQVTQAGFGNFRSDAFCQSRPQSLIGEYYLECDPGQHGSQLKSGATIPVTHTQSTISEDLVNDVLRLPYRERLSLIINELGAAVAGRSGDLQAALQRAVPALTQTDNLLNLLANDSQTINQLNVNADTVLTALANNSRDVQNFIDEANKAATASATQQAAISGTWRQLPGFLEQLRPAMAQLDAATTANTPVLQNLNTAAHPLARLFADLPGFSHASLPALKALGQASVTGKTAVKAAAPTVADLNRFAKPTPELAQNLSIVLHDLDNRNRAVEADARSPGGKGYTGIEALLQYVFNQTLAINTFTPISHELAVDIFVDPLCSPYASPATVAEDVSTYGSQYRRCYAWLGPNQPGINEPDPSNPKACVPDPGGAPPGEAGPKTTACKATPQQAIAQDCQAAAADGKPCAGTASDVASKRSAPSAASARGTPSSSPSRPSASGSGSSSPSAGSPASGGGLGLQQVLGKVLSTLGGGKAAAASAPAASSTPSAPLSSGSAGQAAQLLNYLLAP